jgi:hypothetical protein
LYPDRPFTQNSPDCRLTPNSPLFGTILCVRLVVLYPDRPFTQNSPDCRLTPNSPLFGTILCVRLDVLYPDCRFTRNSPLLQDYNIIKINT